MPYQTAAPVHRRWGMMALCFVSYNNIVVNRMAFGVLQPVMARNESGLIGGLDAESYGDAGSVERVLGEVIRLGISKGTWGREDLVITTKLGGGGRGDLDSLNSVGLSRKHLVEYACLPGPTAA